MANVEKLSITLSKEMADAVREAVDSGDYATTSEVIREALRGWRFKRITVDPSDTATIRKLVEKGTASGRSVDAKPVFDRLKKQYAALAGKRGQKLETRKTVAKRRRRS